ncbi:YfhO family protein [Candidatus Uabimicrobium sp. HlEnr_7]|uniref:YfhO family protein n=1 Tax=Candidatus Uabimicrobium helgolandensis TaxID=3095367 RepID=UPI003556AEC8
MGLRQNWGWFIVTTFSLLASWHYFFGTPHVLGLDYFIHLAQADIIKNAIADGIPIPAYHYLHGAGTTFIRYQGMLIAQMMGWCCYILQIFINVSDTTVIMFVGRLFGILLNLGAGLSFYWAAKKIIEVHSEDKKAMDSAAIVAACAYIFGWSRWGVVLHVGSLQRAGALIFFPIAFAIVVILLRRSLKKNEQVIMAIATSCCLMCHPGSFIYLVITCIMYASISTIINPFECLQWKKWRSLICPAIISLCLAAWFIFPLVLEKEYYGMMRRQQQAQQNVSWSEVLPSKYMLEFVDRDNWFSNLNADAENGGSFLGGFGGVNSAYFGITVILIAIFGSVIFPRSNPLKKVSVAISITTIIIAIIIFWKGFRHNVFHVIGHHLTLPFYWLEPFYFCMCMCVLFGSIVIFEKLCKIVNTRLAKGIMFTIAIIICLDFFTLVAINKAAKMYTPRQGKQDPLGISGNNNVFDAYNVLKNARQGRVLDLPKLLFNCNRLYHKHPDVFAEEPNTDWTEAKYYSDQVAQQEVMKAIPFSLEYSNHCPLPLDEIECNVPKPNDSKYLWEMKQQGNANLSLKIHLPAGKFSCWIVLPTLLSPQTQIETFYQNKSVSKVKADIKGYNYYLIIPVEKKNVAAEFAEIVIKIQKKALSGKVIVGVQKPFIAYNGNSLAHRLAILDVRYIVLNLRYFKPATGRITNSATIRRIHQSHTSALYENTLSSPIIIPQRVMVIKAQKPWKLFEKISHHPNFNPNIVSFCYEGKEIGDIVTDENWETKLVPFFLGDAPKNKTNYKVIHDNIESITYEVNSQQDGLMFLSLHYHPNLVAQVNGKTTKVYLAQAGTIAVNVPAGSSKITIKYQHPWYDKLGKLISLLTVLILIIYIVWQMIKVKRSRNEV